MKLSYARQIAIALVISGTLAASAATGADQPPAKELTPPHPLTSLEENESADDPLDLTQPSLVLPSAYNVDAQPGAMDGMGSMGMTQPASPNSRSPASRTGPSRSRQGNIRLASVPNMFGDVFMSGGTLVLNPNRNDPVGVIPVGSTISLPGAGGSRRVKIGENNASMPVDRVYFMYNHFHNAIQVVDQPLLGGGPPTARDTNVDRYTGGVEKTFFDGMASIDIRMPFNSSFDYQNANNTVSGGSVGNLAMILKGLIYTNDQTAVAVGLGVTLPTGSDVEASVSNTNLEFQNDAVHFLPWVGFQHNWNDRFFALGFAQVDLAANGNEVFAPQIGQSLGEFNEQNLLFLDFSFGMWLYNNPEAERLTSVAVIHELHYTSTMQDTDIVAGTLAGNQFALSNVFNRQDILNVTLALQFGIAETSFLRVAGVAPAWREDDRRAFDAEFQVQFNRLY